jgi:hypothetical protein
MATTTTKAIQAFIVETARTTQSFPITVAAIHYAPMRAFEPIMDMLYRMAGDVHCASTTVHFPKWGHLDSAGDPFPAHTTSQFALALASYGNAIMSQDMEFMWLHLCALLATWYGHVGAKEYTPAIRSRAQNCLQLAGALYGTLMEGVVPHMEPYLCTMATRLLFEVSGGAVALHTDSLRVIMLAAGKAQTKLTDDIMTQIHTALH